MPQRATPLQTAAGHSGDPAPPRPSARERGRMRRRLREQRRMREALLLDLGALVFELQRHGRREPELLQAKAAELSAVDREVRALAEALDAGDGVLQLVATGVAGSCGNCGSLLSTDARYCQACGAPAVPSLAAERGAGGAAIASGRAPQRPAFPEPTAQPPAPPQPPPAFPGPPAPAPGGLEPEPKGDPDGRRLPDLKRPALERLGRMRKAVRRRAERDDQA